MAKKDLRPEQVKLLRFEKTIEAACREKAAGKPLDKGPILAGLAGVAAAGAGAAAKLGTDAPLQAANAIKTAAHAPGGGEQWLIHLADVVSRSHNAIENLAVQGSYALLEASGGTPKIAPSEVVASLLKSGLL